MGDTGPARRLEPGDPAQFVGPEHVEPRRRVAQALPDRLMRVGVEQGLAALGEEGAIRGDVARDLLKEGNGLGLRGALVVGAGQRGVE